MNCADIEILICDYVDGTLDAARKGDLERHLAVCPECAELARDAAAAVSFMERSAEVEPPPELVTRILFDAPWTKAQKRSKVPGWLRMLVSPLLQPKYAMGMAMTAFWLSMLARYVAPGSAADLRKLQLSDLQPTKVWAGMEVRMYRTWARTVKFYENLKFVYRVQTTLREWQQQEEDQRTPNDRKSSEGNVDDRKLPIRSTPIPSATTPGGAPTSNPPGEKH